MRYDIKRDFGRLKTQSVAGLSWRYVHAIGRESFNSGVIALDRRDISVGAMPNDIVDSPFNSRSARHFRHWAGRTTSSATRAMRAPS